MENVITATVTLPVISCKPRLGRIEPNRAIEPVILKTYGELLNTLLMPINLSSSLLRIFVVFRGRFIPFNFEQLMVLYKLPIV